MHLQDLEISTVRQSRPDANPLRKFIIKVIAHRQELIWPDDGEITIDELGVKGPREDFPVVTWRALLSTCKIALCTPKFRYNKPWERLLSLYAEGRNKRDFQWYNVVYYRMLDMDTLEDRLRSGKRLCVMANERVKEGKPVYDRTFNMVKVIMTFTTHQKAFRKAWQTSRLSQNS